MIVLFTDFGLAGPYVGQMKAVLCQEAPGVPVIDLCHDAPAFDPQGAAYLLAAYAEAVPAGSVLLCVVDPGVGGARRAVIVEAAGRRYVGPDNGLLAIAARRGADARAWRITWQPERLSASFHGRDLFAPVAAMLARGAAPPSEPLAPGELAGADWPDELACVIYLDGFGNAVTGLRAGSLSQAAVLAAGGRMLRRARTFGDVAAGEAFWYENANGLAEIAVNRGSAADLLGLAVGQEIAVRNGP